MMSEPYSFSAVIQDAGGGGAFVIVPFDVEAAFGQKRVKVIAMIDGAPYRGSLVRMGTHEHILGVRKDIRAQIGKSIGDEVEVLLREDTEPRVVSLPQDVDAALRGNPQAQNFFEKLSYSHQREYIQWVEEAKRDQTRQDRIARMLAMLPSGKRTHT